MRAIEHTDVTAAAKPLLKPKSVAQALGVSLRTLPALGLPRVLVGGQVRYRPEHLDAFIEKHTVTSKEAG